MKEGDGKTWKFDSFDSVLGYGEVFRDEEVPADLTDTLLAALAAWGDMSNDCERATDACLPFANHADPRVRAVAVSAIGKLIPKLTHSRAEAIATLSHALSDSDAVVKECAESAAQLLSEESGITVKPSAA